MANQGCVINSSEDDPFVGVDEVANHFGVSVSAVRSWVQKKKVPTNSYVKIGTTYRFKIGVMEAALFEQNETADTSEEEDDGPIKLY